MDQGPKGLRVLIVEDERALGDLLQTLLESRCFGVSRANDGMAALKHLQHNDFDAIICDIEMPRMRGDTLYKTMEALKPHLCSRFLFMTGHAGAPEIHSFIQRSNSRLIEKPFTLQEMLGAIKALLDSPGRQPASVANFRSEEPPSLSM